MAAPKDRRSRSIQTLARLPMPRTFRRAVERFASVDFEGLGRAAVGRIGRAAVSRLAARLSALPWPLRQRVTVLKTREHAPAPRGPSTEETMKEDMSPLVLLAKLDGAADFEERRSAAKRLAEAHGDGVLDGLLRARYDRSAEVAEAAVDALAGRPEPSVVPALREVLANAEAVYHPIARAAAVRALGARLPIAELPVVFDAIRDVDSEVSLAAITAVRERDPGQAKAVLLAVIEDFTGYFLPAVRLAAATALEQSGGIDAQAAAALASAEWDPAVRAVLERLIGATEPRAAS